METMPQYSLIFIVPAEWYEQIGLSFSVRLKSKPFSLILGRFSVSPTFLRVSVQFRSILLFRLLLSKCQTQWTHALIRIYHCVSGRVSDNNNNTAMHVCVVIYLRLKRESFFEACDPFLSSFVNGSYHHNLLDILHNLIIASLLLFRCLFIHSLAR